ncbi:MAG: hypothetical protein D4R73_08125 [Deltaproteobacteria bacterium]|nr:MAG: hypothetical protein D4R73_08125 [Deltaproteobacteria bacterium]
MSDIDSKKRSMEESLQRIKEKRSASRLTRTASADPAPDALSARFREWESLLDERLAEHQNTGRRTALPPLPAQPLAGVGGEVPFRQWAERVDAMMLGELGLDRYPLPDGFRLPLQFAENEQAMHGWAARACGLGAQADITHPPRMLHLPSLGTVVNRLAYLESGIAFGSGEAQAYARFAADFAQERWGWGFLLEYTALGQAAGREGLWPALACGRLGLPLQESGEQGKAQALQRIWCLTAAGWEDWVWQYVMFKSRHTAGGKLLEKPRPGRTYELIAKIVNLFPLFINPFGMTVYLRTLLDLFSFLFLEQGEVIPRTLNSVLVAVQDFCSKKDEAVAGQAGMTLSRMLGRFYFSRLETHIGILSTPHATLIACHNDCLDLRKAKDGAALLAQAAKDPRANPDTRLALLSDLDPRIKYDPQAMSTAAWERLRLDGPGDPSVQALS